MCLQDLLHHVHIVCNSLIKPVFQDFCWLPVEARKGFFFLPPLMINLVSVSLVFSLCFLFHLLFMHWRLAQPAMGKLGGAGRTSQVSAQH